MVSLNYFTVYLHGTYENQLKKNQTEIYDNFIAIYTSILGS